ncbi:MAG: ribose-5-phosphate isomerase RpiA, partial [Pseudomonadota bacterium]
MSEDLKKAAAEYALDFVHQGMVVGLGTGSTADHFIRGLAARQAQGLAVATVATSRRSAALAKECGLQLLELGDLERVHVTVDGADEVDGNLTLIKGGGGALLWEKIVAQASDFHVTVVDAAKCVDTLGAFPLPVEVVRFAVGRTVRTLPAHLAPALGHTPKAVLRLGADGAPFVTDEGHAIVDVACGAIGNPSAVADVLSGLATVVDHGLFIGLTDRVVIATPSGIEVAAPP